MKKLLLLIVMFIAFPFLKAEDFSMKIGGFIRTDMFYDTRLINGARDDLLPFYPKNIELNADGVDINAKSNFYFASIATRVNAKFTAPDFLSAKTSGLIEAEFVGQSEAQLNVVRMRHAYLDLDWKNSKLTIGQTWHPMFVTETVPQALSLTAGAPLTPLVRNPQIRYRHKLDNFYVTLAALVQRDFTSPGPNGYSTSYQRFASIPAFDLELKYKSQNGKFVAGAGAEYKTIRPYSEFDKRTVETNLSTITANAFLGFKVSNFDFRTGAWYGGNMADFLMAGGYSIAEYDHNHLPSKYTPMQNVAGFVDLSLKLSDNIAIGVFSALNKNLGFADEIAIAAPIWGRATDVDLLYKVAPRFTYQMNNVQFGFEVDYTGANYGKTQIINNTSWQGKWNETNNVSNTRIILVATYFL